MNYSCDLNKIIYSEYFRSMQNKTQLFYYNAGNHFRTRLTHTLEVEKIALNISKSIIDKNPNLKIDLNLISEIALAHDIGHTPFGHVGERVLNDIVSRNDCIGLLNPSHSKRLFFKHNINSAFILKELNIEDFKIIDGVCKHTSVLKKNIDYGENTDPYKLKRIYTGKYKKYMYEQYSFSLEGQIVAIADEIAQRISDIDDILDNRHIEKIYDIFFDVPKGEQKQGKNFIEEKIYDALIEDVIENVAKNVANKDAFDAQVVDFSSDMAIKNKKLEKYITQYIALSENVRVCDSNSKYIIRQLFKAFYNDITLLPDAQIVRMLNGIRNVIEFKDISKYSSDNEIIDDIKKDRLFSFTGNITFIDIEKVSRFHSIIRKIEDDSDAEEGALFLVDNYIRCICNYIASLNDNDARKNFEKIYK